MRLRKLDKANRDECAFMEELYLSSFPPSERRSVEAMLGLYNGASPFTINMIVKEDNSPIGFISHWDFDTFVYAEHLAVSNTQRNAGYGKKAVQLFLDTVKKPVILEVELPIDEMSIRRIGFYNRMGFKVWDQIPYAQPPYDKGGKEVPMHLLTVGELDLEKDFEKVIHPIFKHAYLIEL